MLNPMELVLTHKGFCGLPGSKSHSIQFTVPGFPSQTTVTINSKFLLPQLPMGFILSVSDINKKMQRQSLSSIQFFSAQ